MKNYFKTALALLPLSLFVIPTQAAIIITPVGTQFTSTMMPGTDYLVSNPSTWVTGGPYGNENANVANYADLTAFSLSGGVQSFGPSASATIKNPLGTSVTAGGYVGADTPYGTGKQVGVGLFIDAAAAAAEGFNLNDFNIYIMFGNVNGLKDNAISVDNPASAFGTNAVPVSEDGPASNSADFVEFNVKGLLSARNANPTYYDSYTSSAGLALVLGAFAPSTSGAAYFSGISFESIPAEVPEPSTYAMMLAGLTVLGFCIRRKAALVK